MWGSGVPNDGVGMPLDGSSRSGDSTPSNGALCGGDPQASSTRRPGDDDPDGHAARALPKPASPGVGQHRHPDHRQQDDHEHQDQAHRDLGCFLLRLPHSDHLLASERPGLPPYQKKLTEAGRRASSAFPNAQSTRPAARPAYSPLAPPRWGGYVDPSLTLAPDRTRTGARAIPTAYPRIQDLCATTGTSRSRKVRTRSAPRGGSPARRYGDDRHLHPHPVGERGHGYRGPGGASGDVSGGADRHLPTGRRRRRRRHSAALSGRG